MITKLRAKILSTRAKDEKLDKEEKDFRRYKTKVTNQIDKAIERESMEGEDYVTFNIIRHWWTSNTYFRDYVKETYTNLGFKVVFFGNYYNVSIGWG